MRVLVLVVMLISGFQFEAAAQPARAAEKKVASSSKIPARSFAVGAELRQYQYLEPGLVEHVGLMYGVWGEWYWQSFIGKGKLYGNVVYGKLTYKGAMCDELGTCYPYEGPTNDVITKVATRLEYDFNRSFQVFGGVGFRYLYDMGEGAGFYRRTGQWLFVPVGLAVSLPGGAGTAFHFELEYDQIVAGQIKSDLSQVSAAFDDLTLQQTGYGLVVKAGYQFTPEWNLEAVYERWDLNKSGSGTTNGQTFHEPKNHSDSYGVRIGYFF